MNKLTQCLVCGALVFLWGCGSPEQTTLEQWFRAAQSNDSATIAAMSAVRPPAPVESWKVVEISSRSIVPFGLAELQRQLGEAKKIRDAQLEEGRAYLVNNRTALDQIIPKLEEDSEFQFDGEFGEVQAAWAGLVQDRKDKEKAFQDAKRALEEEAVLAGKSVMGEAVIEHLEGEVAVTEVLLMIDEKPHTVTLRKYALSVPGAEAVERSRWVVVDIKEKAPT